MNFLQNTESRAILISYIKSGIKLYESTYKIPEVNILEENFESLNQHHLRQPDKFFGELTKGLSGDVGEPTSNNPAEYCQSINTLNNKVFINSSDFDLIANNLKNMLCENMKLAMELSWKELKEEVNRKFFFENKNIIDFDASNDYYFVKVNHGFWEQITKVVLPMRYHHRLRDTIDENLMNSMFFDSFFIEKLFIQMYRNLIRQNEKENVLQGIDFAISFGAGDYSISEILNSKEDEIKRGSMVGAISFVNSLIPKGRLILNDGAMMKSLCKGRLLDDFVAKANKNADAILFIVPPHLENIGMTKGEIPQYVLPIPRFNVHQLWPSISVAVFGVVYALLTKYDDIKIYSQCAVYAAILAFIIKDIKNNLFYGSDKTVHFFDLGRVLDVADLKGCAWQPWTRELQQDHSFINPFTLYK